MNNLKTGVTASAAAVGLSCTAPPNHASISHARLPLSTAVSRAHSGATASCATPYREAMGTPRGWHSHTNARLPAMPRVTVYLGVLVADKGPRAAMLCRSVGGCGPSSFVTTVSLVTSPRAHTHSVFPRGSRLSVAPHNRNGDVRPHGHITFVTYIGRGSFLTTVNNGCSGTMRLLALYPVHFYLLFFPPVIDAFPCWVWHVGFGFLYIGGVRYNK
jgi:hypothetical protein